MDNPSKTITTRQQFEQSFGNKLWRLEHFYKIRDKNRRLVNLKLNPIQKRILASVQGMHPIRKFDLKYRQGGVSTFWLLWWFDDTIFHENTITGVLADKKESLGYLFEIVRLAHANMPTAYQPRLDEDSKTALTFPDLNSKMFVSLSIKATAVHNLHISERAYCKDQEIGRTISACGPMANITSETTGNGVGNDAYQVYWDNKGKAHGETAVQFHPWFIQTEYRMELNGMTPPEPTKEEKLLNDHARTEYGVEITPEMLLWRRSQKQRLKTMFRQEFPETDTDAFLTSGKKFFNVLKVDALLREARQWRENNPPIEQTEDYTVYEKPVQGEIYVAGADPAEGVGDPSCLKIINVSREREAFVYRAVVGVDHFYKVLYKWCMAYNRAILCIERNNHGHAIILGLTGADPDAIYPNLWYDEAKKTRISGKRIAQVERKFGWLSTKEERTLLLDVLKASIQGNDQDDERHFEPDFMVYDENLLSECLTFEELHGKYQAAEGKNDDDIIATGLAVKMFHLKRRGMARGGGLDSFIVTDGQRETLSDG